MPGSVLGKNFLCMAYGWILNGLSCSFFVLEFVISWMKKRAHFVDDLLKDMNFAFCVGMCDVIDEEMSHAWTLGETIILHSKT